MGFSVSTVGGSPVAVKFGQKLGHIYAADVAGGTNIGTVPAGKIWQVYDIVLAVSFLGGAGVIYSAYVYRNMSEPLLVVSGASTAAAGAGPKGGGQTSTLSLNGYVELREGDTIDVAVTPGGVGEAVVYYLEADV